MAPTFSLPESVLREPPSAGHRFLVQSTTRVDLACALFSGAAATPRVTEERRERDGGGERDRIGWERVPLVGGEDEGPARRRTAYPRVRTPISPSALVTATTEAG